MVPRKEGARTTIRFSSRDHPLGANLIETHLSCHPINVAAGILTPSPLTSTQLEEDLAGLLGLPLFSYFYHGPLSKLVSSPLLQGLKSRGEAIVASSPFPTLSELADDDKGGSNRTSLVDTCTTIAITPAVRDSSIYLRMASGNEAVAGEADKVAPPRKRQKHAPPEPSPSPPPPPPPSSSSSSPPPAVATAGTDARLHISVMGPQYRRLGLQGKKCHLKSDTCMEDRYHVSVDLHGREFAPGRHHYDRVHARLAEELVHVGLEVCCFNEFTGSSVPLELEEEENQGSAPHSYRHGLEFKELKPVAFQGSAEMVDLAQLARLAYADTSDALRRQRLLRALVDTIGLGFATLAGSWSSSSWSPVPASVAEEGEDGGGGGETGLLLKKSAGAAGLLWKGGLFSSRWILQLVDAAFDLVEKYSLPWAAVGVWGSKNSPIGWLNSSEHSSGLDQNGENDLIILVMPHKSFALVALAGQMSGFTKL